MISRSPSRRTCGALMRLPLMNVPLVDCRSTTISLSSRMTTRACRFETVPPSSTMSLPMLRVDPMVTSLRKNRSSRGLVPVLEIKTLRPALPRSADRADTLVKAKSSPSTEASVVTPSLSLACSATWGVSVEVRRSSLMASSTRRVPTVLMVTGSRPRGRTSAGWETSSSPSSSGRMKVVMASKGPPSTKQPTKHSARGSRACSAMR